MGGRDYKSILFSPEEIADLFDDLFPAVSRSEYHDYIQSPAWIQKAEQCKKKAGYRCQLCHISGFARPLHVHHNNYYHLGNELDTDLVVLCADCHKMFHDSGIGVQREIKLSKEQFSLVLKSMGVTYNNSDPYYYYELGKQIINQLNVCLDPNLYDYYNRVNSDILYAAIENMDKRAYQQAKKSEDWDGYYSERDWRSAHDYWTGWKG